MPTPMRSLLVLLCSPAILSLSLLSLACESNGSTQTVTAEEATPGNSQRNLRAGVPPQAQEVAQGTGSISYIASENGQLYLYDANMNRVIGMYNLRPGQELILAETGRAAIDGNEVTVSGDLRGSRSYIAYFLPLPEARTAGDDATYRITPVPPRGQ